MRNLTFAATALVAISASQAFAVGSDDETPPTQTQTTTECTDGQIYDETTKACVESEKQSFNDDTRYDAVRELAYAEAYDRAELVIASADNPTDPRFLNYRGFISRKQGDMGQAMEFYTAALAQAPDYHLARSYMGQGLAASGDVDAAKVQLQEIVMRGGRNTWAYHALKTAIAGKPSGY